MTVSSVMPPRTWGSGGRRPVAVANVASAGGSSVWAAEAPTLRQLYGLVQPSVVKYGKWMGRMLHGDFGE